jgi:hypothetical protein
MVPVDELPPVTLPGLTLTAVTLSGTGVIVNIVLWDTPL